MSNRFLHLFTLNLLLGWVAPTTAECQTSGSIEQLIELAWEHNNLFHPRFLLPEKKDGKDVEIEKTLFYFNKDENNLPPTGAALNVWGIQQKMRFPTIYVHQNEVTKAESRMDAEEKKIQRLMVAREVCRQYYNLMYYQQLQFAYAYLDSIYEDYFRTTEQPAGTAYNFRKSALESRWQEVRLQHRQAQLSAIAALGSLKMAVQAEIPFSLDQLALRKVPSADIQVEDHPGIAYFRQAQQAGALKTKVQKEMLLPDIQLEYFRGRNRVPNGPIYNGVQVGIAVPLFYGPQKENVEAARSYEEKVHQQAENYVFSLTARMEQLKTQRIYYLESLNYYEVEWNPTKENTIRAISESFSKGDIDRIQYIEAMERVKVMEINYFNNLQGYNQVMIEMNYLSL